MIPRLLITAAVITAGLWLGLNLAAWVAAHDLEGDLECPLR